MRRSKRPPVTLRQRMLILCEGQTERRYFQAIREDADFKHLLTAVQVEVAAARHPAPLQVVREAERRFRESVREANPFDQVWVVFDHDHHPSRRQAYDRAIETGFQVAFSAPAFELWYLLHFVQTTRIFVQPDELIKNLQQYQPNYQKARQNDFAHLKQQLGTALTNAMWLRAQVHDETTHCTDHLTWTNVDLLVKTLIQKND